MPDTTQMVQTTGQTANSSQSQVVVDKNKTAEQYLKEAESKYIVPRLVREKFPDLIKLIYETESMNEEEREYWLQIMPIMTEEQIVKFRNILVNEKEQLAKLDKEYSSGMKGMAASVEIDEQKLKERLAEIKEEEKVSQKEEQTKADGLLKELQNL